MENWNAKGYEWFGTYVRLEPNDTIRQMMDAVELVEKQVKEVVKKYEVPEKECKAERILRVYPHDSMITKIGLADPLADEYLTFGYKIGIPTKYIDANREENEVTENRFDIAEFAREVHENAKAHGWWDEPRNGAKVRALIHSEWSEALEEARAGRPLVWHGCKSVYTDICELCETCANKADGKVVELCPLYMEKPEGIAIELIDGCIRILDCLVQRGGNIHKNIDMLELEKDSYYAMCADVEENKVIEKSVTKMSVEEVVDLLHYTTAFDRENEKNGMLLYAFGVACAWVRAQGLDPVKLMQEKHEYNKSRPYKHGKKF